MKNKTLSPFEDNTMKFYMDDCIAVMIIKKNIFELLSKVDQSEQILRLFDAIDDANNIKALLIINDDTSFSEEIYYGFLKRTVDTESIYDRDSLLLHPEIRKLRMRGINILNRTILKWVEFQKIILFGLQGNIITPFFGACLAGDFRYATEDMNFVFELVSVGFHPTGALPLLLPRYVGETKAAELLYRCHDEKLTATDAVNLSLVNQIFPKEDFIESCITEAKKLGDLDNYIIKMTRSLFKSNLIAQLKEYFEIEATLLKIIKT